MAICYNIYSLTSTYLLVLMEQLPVTSTLVFAIEIYGALQFISRFYTLVTISILQVSIIRILVSIPKDTFHCY